MGVLGLGSTGVNMYRNASNGNWNNVMYDGGALFGSFAVGLLAGSGASGGGTPVKQPGEPARPPLDPQCPPEVPSGTGSPGGTCFVEGTAVLVPDDAEAEEASESDAATAPSAQTAEALNEDSESADRSWLIAAGAAVVGIGLYGKEQENARDKRRREQERRELALLFETDNDEDTPDCDLPADGPAEYSGALLRRGRGCGLRNRACSPNTVA